MPHAARPSYALCPAALLLLRGPDALDFAHRLSSGQLKPLVAAEPRQTLFCGRDGKLVAWCTAWALGDDVGLEIRGPAHLEEAAAAAMARRLQAALEPYLIMEEVTLTLPQTPYLTLQGEGDGLQGAADLFAFPGGIRQLLPAAEAARTQARLQAAGATQLSATELELRRIAAGVPDPAKEGPHPLELRLQAPLLAAISWTKGCYVGQEVISRLENYRKVARLLVGVRLAAPMPTGIPLSACRITDEGGALLGRLTSCCGRLGLGVVKRAAAVPRGVVVHADGWPPQPAQLEERPFFAGSMQPLL